MAKPSQSQVREINRTLLATVRADWKYPEKRTRGRMLVEPLSYRERYYSTSDGERDGSEDESDPVESSDDDTVEASWSSPETEKDFNPLDDAGAAAAAAAAGVDLSQLSRHSSKKRKFKSPADVAAYLECKVRRRRRKRLMLMAEELRWNDGLRHFTQRRNAWTGAITPEQVEERKKRQEEAKQQDTYMDTAEVAAAVQPDVKNERKDSTSSASNEDDTDSSIASSPTLHDASKDHHSSPSPDPSQPPSPEPEDPLSLITVLTPIAIPFLPATHPVRASIMSRSHAELYEKIVRDGRTPAVPLNLAHMMTVIVQGWKDEGNWPPKSALAEAGLLNNVGGRRRLKGANCPVGSSSHVRVPSDSKIAGLFEGHKHLQRGVESVRRAFRLSGSGPPAGAGD